MSSSTISRFCDKVTIQTIHEAFQNIDSIAHVDLAVNQRYPTHSFMDQLTSSHNNNQNILIIEAYYIDVDGDIREDITVNNTQFELRVVSRVWAIGTDKQK